MRIGDSGIAAELPHEPDGSLAPGTYGSIEVIHDDTSLEERRSRVGASYRDYLATGGAEIQRLNPYLKYSPYDPEPARQLVAKHQNLPDPYACQFGGALLDISQGVFCPTLTNVSPFLLRHVDFKPGERVLDAFTGSGAFAVSAALRGGTAVAYDISPLAAANAKKNAFYNDVSDRVDVRTGTLPEIIAPNEKFDLIIANPPLIPGDPENPLEQALFDAGLNATKEFVAMLPGILAKAGRAYLVTSDVIEREGYEVDIERLCREASLAIQTIAKLHRRYESYRVHKIEHPSFKVWVQQLIRKKVL